jgi:hypothetical protein
MESLCNRKGIPQWKMDIQYLMILQRLLKFPQQTMEGLYRSIEDNFVVNRQSCNIEVRIRRLENEKKRQDVRLHNLTDKWLDGQLSDEPYQQKKHELEEKVHSLKQQIHELEEQEQEAGNTPEEEEAAVQLGAVKETLYSYGKLSDNGVPHKDLIEAFCVRVTPQENGVYKWYLNFGEELSIDRPFDEKEYHLIDRFCIDFDTARDYRKRHGSFMRRNAWEDLHTEVYLHFGKAE